MIPSRQPGDIESVRELLRYAFAKRRYWESRQLTPDVRSRIEDQGGEFGLGRPDSPEDRKELCSFFYLIGPDHVGYLVPVLLEAIMDVYTEGMVDTPLLCDMSDVISILDVPNVLPKARRDALEKTFGKREVRRQLRIHKELHETKTRQFVGLDRYQASAIYEWLLLVRCWHDIPLFPYKREQLDRSIEYWKDRSNISPE